MSFRLLVQGMLASMLVCTQTSGAAAQALDHDQSVGPCFAIVVPQTQMRLPSPLLFNKCTGETWMLVKTRTRSGTKPPAGAISYRWVRLEVERSFPSSPKDRPVSQPKPVVRPVDAQNGCFEFVGRRFCE